MINKLVGDLAYLVLGKGFSDVGEHVKIAHALSNELINYVEAVFCMKRLKDRLNDGLIKAE